MIILDDCSGGRDQEEQSSRTDQAKVSKSPTSANNNPSYVEVVDRRICSKVNLGKKSQLYLKKNLKQRAGGVALAHSERKWVLKWWL